MRPVKSAGSETAGSRSRVRRSSRRLLLLADFGALLRRIEFVRNREELAKEVVVIDRGHLHTFQADTAIRVLFAAVTSSNAFLLQDKREKKSVVNQAGNGIINLFN